jgi:hypothetical protein
MTAWLPESLTGPRVIVGAAVPDDPPALAAPALAAPALAAPASQSTSEQYGLSQRQYEFRF